MSENVSTPKLQQGEGEKAGDLTSYDNRRSLRFPGNNKGLPCLFKPILCQEGYYSSCQIYLDRQKL